jgi:hypothetical protein
MANGVLDRANCDPAWEAIEATRLALTTAPAGESVVGGGRLHVGPAAPLSLILRLLPLNNASAPRGHPSWRGGVRCGAL